MLTQTGIKGCGARMAKAWAGIAALLFFFPLAAEAATKRLDAGFSLSVPDGWELAERDIATITPPAVSGALDCLDPGNRDIKLVGWKTDAGGKLEGAFCVVHRKENMAAGLAMLASADQKEREKAAAAISDGLASAVYSGYKKRQMRVVSLYADVINAGNDAIVVMDGKISGPAGNFTRSGTVFLRGDALLHISSVYDPGAPSAVLQELDAIGLSVQW